MRTTEHIKRVAKVTTGSTPPTNESRFYETEDVDWFTPSDMNELNIFCCAEKRIAEKFFSETVCKKIPAESVLVVGIGATVGKVGYSNHECYANQQINAICFDHHKVLPKYGAYWFLRKKEEINKTTPTVTLPIFNQSKVKMLMISYPNLAEQRKIIDYLDEKASAIDTQIELLEKKKNAYNRLKKAMINRAVTRGLDEHVKLKDSGVEWIGMIPEHWEVKRIKELCSFVSRGSTPDYVDESDFAVMNQAVFSSGCINHEVVRYSSYMKPESKIEKGDLLIASTGGGILGKLFFFNDENEKFYADTHVTIVRSSKKSFYVKFLYYLFSIGYDMINSCMAKGSTNQTELQKDKLIAYEIAIPSIEEQPKIIEYLDGKCAKIDSAIENIGKQIDASKRLKRALINEVITGQRAV